MRFLFLLLIFVIGESQLSFAQSRDLVNRLNRLENEVQTLNDAYFRGKKPPANTYNNRSGSLGATQAAQLEVRLSQMEQQIRDLTGRIEENTFASRRLEGDLQRTIQDLTLRLQDLERGRGTAPSIGLNPPQPDYGIRTLKTQRITAAPKPLNNTQNQTKTGSNANPLPDTVKQLGSLGGNGGDPVSAYEAAFAQLRSGDYGNAEAGFRDFLSAHPDHNLAANAQYWLAETYYVRGNYEQSARGFAIGFQKYPESSKAADNLLKLGLSLANSGKKDDACLTFGQLESTYPTAPTPLKRRVAQEKKRLGC